MNNPLTPVEALQREIDRRNRLNFLADPIAVAALEFAKADEDRILHIRSMPVSTIWDSKLGELEKTVKTARAKLYEALQQ